MKTILCYVVNTDSNIASYNKYFKVKPGRACTEQTVEDFFEENIHISSTSVPEVKCIQTIFLLFLNKVEVFGGNCFGKITFQNFSVIGRIARDTQLVQFGQQFN